MPALKFEPSSVRHCIPLEYVPPEMIKSHSMEEGKQHVTIAFPNMEELLRRGCMGGDALHLRFYLFCQTITNIVAGFDLLETLMISHDSSRWPVVMVTLYEKGSREGITQHMKVLTKMCSSPSEPAYSPKVRTGQRPSDERKYSKP